MKLKNLKPFALIAMIMFVVAGCGLNPQTPVTDSNPNELYCKGLPNYGGTVAVKVHRLDDQHCYPVGIFTKPTDPDKCDGIHYHYTLVSLDGHERHDEGDPCGAAKRGSIEATGNYLVSPEVINKWNAQWEAQGQEPIDIGVQQENAEVK